MPFLNAVQQSAPQTLADIEHLVFKERQRQRLWWALCCILAGSVFLFYVSSSLAVGQGEPIMPLDDVYIHFQYARQMAAGQPYVYNPGLPPSSGATSFLYPYLLAVGWLLGFQGLHLGLWAMGMGAVALAGASWLVYRMARVGGLPERLAVVLIPVFALNGAISWHFMSGMETGLVVLLTLWTVYAVVAGSNGQFVLAAALTALIRPEAAVLVMLAAGAALFDQWRWRRTIANWPIPLTKAHTPRFFPLWLLLLPVLAVGAQPLVNLLVTGSAVASGSAAKSVMGIVPFVWDEALRRILENFVRLWVEVFSGASPREGLYLLPGLPLLAVLGLAPYWHRATAAPLRERVLWVGVIVGWLLGGTLAVSTLDTAFWHFKRYQMPFMALLFPLAGWGMAWIGTRYSASLRYAIYGVAALLLVSSLWTWPQFLGHYVLNAGYVYQQPLQMARWLQANTPETAVVAVHDTGLLRYMGGRTTIDMVGLTTPGAADYWRSGPGAVAEFLMKTQPDYIAAYGPGHGFGLSMVADTRIYGAPLAEFPVTLDDRYNRYNVALAAAYQGIYQPDWESVILRPAGLQASIWDDLSEISTPVAQLNVADLDAERAADYHWSNQGQLSGFPTEVHELDYLNCIHSDPQGKCRMADGGRRINGEESFTLTFKRHGGITDGLLLITRLQSFGAATLDVYANGVYVATRWIPDIPGQWLEVPTRIPNPGRDSAERLQIRIVPHGLYAPYYHVIHDAGDSSSMQFRRPETEIATYQSGAIVLVSIEIDYQPGAEQVGFHFVWYTDGSATGDYVAFVHLYDDVNQPPVAQTDIRPGGGTLPPGNWVPGLFHDTIMVKLKDVTPGSYQAAIGFYDPATFERLLPDSGSDEQGRLFIGVVEIE